MDFKIVVPCFNCEQWIEACLRSIQTQTERSLECVVYDDASTDGTGAILDGMVLDDRFLIVHNPRNLGALANIVDGFKRLGAGRTPGAVLVQIDGDDQLAHDRVLETVRRVYEADPECLLTYGNYIGEPGGTKGICESYPEEVVIRRRFRKHKFVASHLRTFKAVLWNNIGEQDLRDPRTGEFWRVTWDLAFMMPMLEMAGKRFRFVEDILYIYNAGNPLNDSKVHGREQFDAARYLRDLPRYPRLGDSVADEFALAARRRLLEVPGLRRLIAWRCRIPSVAGWMRRNIPGLWRVMH